MRHKKFIDVIATISLLIGAILAFLPHAIHIAVGLGDDTHLRHVIFGILIMVISLGVLISNNKAWNINISQKMFF